jgi:hypothetical protein
MSVPTGDPLTASTTDPFVLSFLALTLSKNVTEYMQAGNFPKAIELSTNAINLINKAIADNPSDLLQPLLGPSLFEIYAYRAVAYGMSGDEDRAVQDVKIAMAMPAAYQNAQLVGLLQKHIASAREGSSDSSTGPQKQEEKDKCFIATAAYGSALAPEVATLRQFRDVRLKPNRAGQLFVRLYERFSPPLADWIASHRTARVWVQRLALAPIVWIVRRWTTQDIQHNR